MANSFLTIQRTNTILYCGHWQETVHFYEAILNLAIVFKNDWFVEFQLMDSSFLSIVDASRATISAVKGQGITLTWQVNDLKAVRARLEDLGVTTTEIKYKWDAWVFYCHDPEGHRLEFWRAA